MLVLRFGASEDLRFLCDSNGITSQHLDGYTKSLRLKNRLGGILTWRVEHGDHTKQLPWLVVLLDSNTKGSETTASELLRLLVVQVTVGVGTVGNLHNSARRTLGTDILIVSETTLSSNPLGHRVEGRELVRPPALTQNLASLGVALKRQDGNLVDGIEGLDVVRTGQGGYGHHPVDVHAFGDVRLPNAQLIGCQGTGLVRAENVHTLCYLLVMIREPRVS